MPTALIIGATGQDSSYLAELLLEKGYEVHGTVRRASTINTERIDHIKDRLKLHYADLTDEGSLEKALLNAVPDEVYNLGAMSHVKVSFDVPAYTSDVTGTGSIKLLEAIRRLGLQPRIYQASSSEMFGSNPPPQNEATPFHPRSPYGCAKVFSYWATVNYREAYNMHASNGILFNHESPRRGENFVTRKIAKAVARIHAGLQKKLHLGNLNAARDWGHAKDYVEAMWLMLQQEKPDDYVIATGEMHTVQEFVDEAFRVISFDPSEFIVTDSTLFRPSEVEALQGDPTKAMNALGWKPKVTFKQLVLEMVTAEIKNLDNNLR
jgi:GDPmannose 4,6-dehydratase